MLGWSARRSTSAPGSWSWRPIWWGSSRFCCRSSDPPVGDRLGPAKSGGRHRHLSVDRALELAPGLRRPGLQGAMLYSDGMEDDARYTLAVLRTARREGGLAATRVRALTARREGERVAGAAVRDELTRAEFHVRARTVLDATGVWGSEPARPFGGEKA